MSERFGQRTLHAKTPIEIGHRGLFVLGGIASNQLAQYAPDWGMRSARTAGAFCPAIAPLGASRRSPQKKFGEMKPKCD